MAASGCSSMVEQQLPKLNTRVRFPSPAPILHKHLKIGSFPPPSCQNCVFGAHQRVTRLGHKRSVRGLSLRGSIYQFRVRVPLDLRASFGKSHVKRSLCTDSLSLAIRLARKAEFEIDAMFEAARREAGLKYEERLPLDQVPTAPVPRTIARRSIPVQPVKVEQSDIATLTLSDSYERFLNDPTKRRSARTMLAHHTTRRVMEDVLGGSTPLNQIRLRGRLGLMPHSGWCSARWQALQWRAQRRVLRLLHRCS